MPSGSPWCASTITPGRSIYCAHEFVTENARYAYVFYAVALNSTGALVSIARDKGDFAAALEHARVLLTLDPGNAQLQALVAETRKEGASASVKDLDSLPICC